MACGRMDLKCKFKFASGTCGFPSYIISSPKSFFPHFAPIALTRPALALNGLKIVLRQKARASSEQVWAMGLFRLGVGWPKKKPSMGMFAGMLLLLQRTAAMKV